MPDETSLPSQSVPEAENQSVELNLGSLPVCVLILLWGYVVYRLGTLWHSNDDYAYGWFVPLLCLALFWERWKRRPARSPARPASGTFFLFGMSTFALLPASLFVEIIPQWRFAGWIFAGAAIGLTSITLYFLGGLPLFRADRSHIHHHLLDSGLSRRHVVLVTYGFTAIFLALGFVAFWWHGEHLAILLGLGILITLLAAGQMNFSREWFAVGRVLGNSLNMRSEIQYALALTRWLAMEGTRCQTIAALREDVLFIARKLGFNFVRIRLEDDEQTWQTAAAKGADCRLFKHALPGHRYCFIELGVVLPQSVRSANDGSTAKIMPSDVRTKSGPSSQTNGNQTASAEAEYFERKFSILSELLAEGWAKAIATWEKQNQLPARFDGLKSPASENQTKEIPGVQPEAV